MLGLSRIIQSVVGLFSKDLGIDLGTANTVVVARGEEILANEPSVVAIVRDSDHVLAVGSEAKRMLGKTPGDIQAIRPLKEGVISNAKIAERMLQYFITKAHHGRRFLVRPRVLIAVPAGITDVEKDAVFLSAHKAGARKVYLVEEPRAAAIGAGLPIEEPRGHMVVDVGGGTTEIAVISCASIESWSSIRVGGDAFDEAIKDYVWRTYDLRIGPQTAERVKIEIGSAAPLKEELKMTVRGRSRSGLPREVTLSSEEIREALHEPVMRIVQEVKNVLEKTQEELAADLVETGIVLTGGGAMLRNLTVTIEQETGLPTRLADDSLYCVARGCLRLLENLERFSSLLTHDERS